MCKIIKKIAMNKIDTYIINENNPRLYINHRNYITIFYFSFMPNIFKIRIPYFPVY